MNPMEEQFSVTRGAFKAISYQSLAIPQAFRWCIGLWVSGLLIFQVAAALPPDGPRLMMQRQGNTISFSWEGSGTLERAEFVDGVWEAQLGALSPHSTQTSREAAFYRIDASRVVQLGTSLRSVVNPSNGHTYHLIGPLAGTNGITNGITWEGAEATAVGLGGRLVTVGDQEESDWIASTFPEARYLWTGLHSPTNAAGSYGWSSGQALSYDGWIAGEPGAPHPTGTFAVIDTQASGPKRWRATGMGPDIGGLPVYGLAEVEPLPVLTNVAPYSLSEPWLEGALHADVVHQVTFNEGAIMSGVSRMEYSTNWFPPTGWLQFDMTTTNADGSLFGTQRGVSDQSRLPGDFLLEVRGGRIFLGVDPVGGSDPLTFPGVTSSNTVIDGVTRNVVAAYGAHGLRLYVDGILEGESPGLTVEMRRAPVTVGAVAQRLFPGFTGVLRNLVVGPAVQCLPRFPWLERRVYGKCINPTWNIIEEWVWTGCPPGQGRLLFSQPDATAEQCPAQERPRKTPIYLPDLPVVGGEKVPPRLLIQPSGIRIKDRGPDGNQNKTNFLCDVHYHKDVEHNATKVGGRKEGMYEIHYVYACDAPQQQGTNWPGIPANCKNNGEGKGVFTVVGVFVKIAEQTEAGWIPLERPPPDVDREGAWEYEGKGTGLVKALDVNWHIPKRLFPISTNHLAQLHHKPADEPLPKKPAAVDPPVKHTRPLVWD